MKKNALEWIVFGLGLAMILGTVGFLGREIASGPPKGPNLRIERGPTERRGEVYELVVTVTNAGDRPASAVEVSGTLGDENPGFTLENVPQRSSRKGLLRFSKDPRTAELSIDGAESPD